MTVDSIQNFVGVNTRPTVPLDVAGQTIIRYGATFQNLDITGGSGTIGSVTLNAGSTYRIYAWGGGGAGNSGMGGAGGYAETTLVNPTSAVLGWTLAFGGASGGGNALVVTLGGATLMYVPGGGAGSTGGTTGAAAGEVQGSPQPEGGVSSTATGVTARATFVDPTFRRYTIGSTFNATGAITFTQGSVFGGYSVGAGTLLFTTPQINNDQGGTGPAGYTRIISRTTQASTVILNSPSLSFVGSTFESLQQPLPLTQSGINMNLDYGTSATTGGGTATYDNWDSITYASFNRAFVSHPGSTPFVQGPAGGLVWSGSYTSGTIPSGSTFTFDILSGSFPSFSQVPSGTGTIFNLPAGTSFSVPFNLLLSGGTFATSGTVTIPQGSNINVSARVFNAIGATSSNSSGTKYGGGGYTGGGSPATLTAIPGLSGVFVNPFNRPAGGGAGSWFIANSITGTTYGGYAQVPYVNKFNRYGIYGAGNSGTTPTPGYLVVQQIANTVTTANALEVYGNERVSGTLYVAGSITTPSYYGVVNMPPGNASAKAYLPSGLAVGTPPSINASIDSSGIGSFSGISASGNIFQSGISTGLTIKQGTVSPNQVSFIYGDGSGWRARFGREATPTLDIADNGTMTVNGTATATDFTISSDSRLKENVITVDSALDKVMKMRGVYFNKLNDTTRRIGLIAQEIEQILPEVVHTDNTPEKMKAVSYANIVGVLIEAIKEQQEMINKLMQNTM